MYIEYLKQVEPLCTKVLETSIIETKNDNNSKSIEINESIEKIKVKQSEKEINENTLLNHINKIKNSTIKMVCNDEAKDFRRINSILNQQDLNFTRSQRYVIGQYLADKILKRENSEKDFLNLHYNISNINANINKVVDDMKIMNI